jgi:glyoxylase I family protein
MPRLSRPNGRKSCPQGAASFSAEAAGDERDNRRGDARETLTDENVLRGEAGREVKKRRGLESFASMPIAPTPPPFRLERIEHVLLLVDNLASAVSFYADVLGAKVETRLLDYAMVEFRAGASHLDVVDISAPEGAWALPPVTGGRNVDHVALRLDAPDETALRRHLAAHGVEIVEERVEGEGEAHSLSLYVRDPSGNMVELMT